MISPSRVDRVPVPANAICDRVHVPVPATADQGSIRADRHVPDQGHTEVIDAPVDRRAAVSVVVVVAVVDRGPIPSIGGM